MDSMDLKQLNKFIESMKGGSIKNYILEGLTSTLIDQGSIRLFESSRHQTRQITPHSHTYHLFCVVLSGGVFKKTWTLYEGEFGERSEADFKTDEFMLSTIEKTDKFGKYKKTNESVGRYFNRIAKFNTGNCYEIKQGEIHSIDFSKDAVVLVFQSPEVEEISQVIEPIYEGEVIETLITEDWMFLKQPKGEVEDE